MSLLSYILFRPYLENHIHPWPPGKKGKDCVKAKNKNKKQKISSRAGSCSEKE